MIHQIKVMLPEAVGQAAFKLIRGKWNWSTMAVNTITCNDLPGTFNKKYPLNVKSPVNKVQGKYYYHFMAVV